MQAILLSIRPNFADLILDKKKCYEFRRVIFKSPDVRRVILYSSSPVQKIVGEFEVDIVLSKCIRKLWRETRQSAGIEKAYYDSYFKGKTVGHAIKIKSVKPYKKPKCLKRTYGIERPPQSFMYINK